MYPKVTSKRKDFEGTERSQVVYKKRKLVSGQRILNGILTAVMVGTLLIGCGSPRETVNIPSTPTPSVSVTPKEDFNVTPYPRVNLFDDVYSQETLSYEPPKGVGIDQTLLNIFDRMNLGVNERGATFDQIRHSNTITRVVADNGNTYDGEVINIPLSGGRGSFNIYRVYNPNGDDIWLYPDLRVGGPGATVTLTPTPIPPTSTPQPTEVPPTNTPPPTTIPPTSTPQPTEVPPTNTPPPTTIPPTSTPQPTEVPPTINTSNVHVAIENLRERGINMRLYVVSSSSEDVFKVIYDDLRRRNFIATTGPDEGIDTRGVSGCPYCIFVPDYSVNSRSVASWERIIQHEAWHSLQVANNPDLAYHFRGESEGLNTRFGVYARFQECCAEVFGCQVAAGFYHPDNLRLLMNRMPEQEDLILAACSGNRDAYFRLKDLYNDAQGDNAFQNLFPPYN